MLTVIAADLIKIIVLNSFPSFHSPYNFSDNHHIATVRARYEFLQLYGEQLKVFLFTL